MSKLTVIDPVPSSGAHKVLLFPQDLHRAYDCLAFKRYQQIVRGKDFSARECINNLALLTLWLVVVLAATIVIGPVGAPVKEAALISPADAPTGRLPHASAAGKRVAALDAVTH